MNGQVGRRRIVIGGISLIVATVLFAARVHLSRVRSTIRLCSETTGQ